MNKDDAPENKLFRSKTIEGFISFAELARNHNEHVHCVVCCGCIIDPSEQVRLAAPVWCMGCRDATDERWARAGRKDRPWLWDAKATPLEHK